VGHRQPHHRQHLHHRLPYPGPDLRHQRGDADAINTAGAVARYCRDNTLNITVGTANATASRAGWQLR